ncbi:uncharacterized protein LOC115767102 [Drosophila novamexicana]|uniref:uncharacterized protein LOC115767102 n=1 Tax=Drosophila novamexicana TaxID=47314 RepID=UPI0011E5BC89|nr:uncharacterized protein LOC115767102 [Drosophila novamexicana]
MDARERTEDVNLQKLSNMQSDMEENANGTVYTALPPSGVYTDVNVVDYKHSNFCTNEYRRQNASYEQNHLDKSKEGAFGYCNYAPSQAFTGNCESDFCDCPTTSKKAASQNYAVDSCCCDPNQPEFQYTNLGNITNNLNIDRNTAGMVGFDPDRNMTSSLDGQEYDGLHNANQSAQTFYSDPSLMSYHGMMNTDQLNDCPFHNMDGYSGDFSFSGGRGNNFNHFPNGTLMDIHMPGAMPKSSPFYGAESPSQGDNYDVGGLFPDVCGTQQSEFYGLGNGHAMHALHGLPYPTCQTN